jgi:hypothetical protein
MPILSKEKQPDGSMVVYGKATDDALDLDNQIVDKKWSEQALQSWFRSFGNIRAMHSTQIPPAGKAIELETKADGHYIRAKVVEPTAIRLVDEGVYSSFSVGIGSPRIQMDPIAKRGRIVDGRIVEVSLVDFPANTGCKFQIAKSASNGSPQLVEKCVDPSCGCPLPEEEAPRYLEYMIAKHQAAQIGKAMSPSEFHVHADGTSHPTVIEGDFVDEEVEKVQAPPATEEEEKEDQDADDDSTGDEKDQANATTAGKSARISGTATQLSLDAATTSDVVGKSGHIPPGKDLAPAPLPSEHSAVGCGCCGECPMCMCSTCKTRNVTSKSGIPVQRVAEVLYHGVEMTKAEAKAIDKAVLALLLDDIDKRDVSGGERDTLQHEGQALDLGQEHSSYPIASVQDLKNAIRAYGRAKPGDRAKVRAHIRRNAKRLGAAELIPDEWSGGEKAIEEIAVAKADGGGWTPCKSCNGKGKVDGSKCSTCKGSGNAKASKALTEEVKALHDALCWAYPVEKVQEAHPEIFKNGIATLLGPLVQGLIFKMLDNEVDEDGGSGGDAMNIACLAKAYKGLVGFLAQEVAEPQSFAIEGHENALLAARAVLHKSFTDMYPSTHLNPETAGSPSPGQFRRAAITAGHARNNFDNNLSASSRSVAKPTHPVDPDNYDRGYLTSGHASNSPANKVAVKKSNKRRDKTAELIMEVHDLLQKSHPEICPLEMPAEQKNIDEGKLPTNVLNPVEGERNELHGRVMPPTQSMDLVHSGNLNSGPTATSATGDSVTFNTATAPTWDKAADPELIKAQVAEQVETVKNQLVTEYEAKLRKLQEQVEALEKMPDPWQEPFRGSALLPKNAKAEAQKRSPEQWEKSLEYLQNQAIHAPDPATRVRAQELLRQQKVAGS